MFVSQLGYNISVDSEESAIRNALVPENLTNSSISILAYPGGVRLFLDNCPLAEVESTLIPVVTMAPDAARHVAATLLACAEAAETGYVAE